MLEVREPFNIDSKFRKIKAGKPLSYYMHVLQLDVKHLWVNGVWKIDWRDYFPKQDDFISVQPAVGAKSFTAAFLTKLNEDIGDGGKFLKAVQLVENPVGPVVKYFVDHERSIIFDGNTYNPLPMEWSGLDINQGMTLPTMRVAVPNLGGEVVDYLEELDVLENDVTLLLLHLDLLGDTTAFDKLLFQIQGISGDQLVAVLDLGINVGIEDRIPREVITTDEFPGIPIGNQRIF